MYAFKRADRMGITVEELANRMTSRELTEWMVFDRLNVTEEWHQTANICYWLIQLLGDAKLKRRVKYEDLLPRRTKTKPMSAAAMKAAMMSIVAGMNKAAPCPEPSSK